MRKRKWEHIPLILLQLLVNMATVGAAILLNALIDATEISITSKDARYLQDIMVVSAIYAAGTGILVYLSNRYKACYVRKSLLSMRKTLANGTLRTGIADYEKAGSASYVTAFNQNFSIIEERVLQNQISILDSVISIVLAVLVLLWMNPLIAVISTVAMAIPSLLPRLFTKALGKAQKTVLESTTAYNEKVSDLLNGHEVIKTYHAEEEMLPQFSAGASRLESSRERMSTLMAKLYGLTTFSSVAVQFFVMGLAGFFAVRGYITLGSIVAVTQLTGQVISPAFGLSAKISELKSAKPVLETLDNLSNPEPSGKNVRYPLKEGISLRDVSFRYADRSILKNVSATFEKGKKYAIIGKSGSGKSTLLKLLAGYYNEFDGDIYTDESAAIPDGIAMIHQSTFLFRDSIRNNISMWKPYTEQEIMEAVKKAGMMEFVNALPQGLDTIVEENGSNFSGGECQRIAIARALLSGKEILLMDEATSALDEQTAKAVERSILSLENITCISVTHRLAPEAVPKYTEVFAMDAGQLHPSETCFDMS
jgi:ABC-type multidrug transport system fused ATPase/permease subunit